MFFYLFFFFKHILSFFINIFYLLSRIKII